MIGRCRELKLACGRLRATAENGIHRVVDGEDRSLALQSVATTVARIMKRLRVLVLVASGIGAAGFAQGAQRTGNKRHGRPNTTSSSTLRAAGHEVRPLGVQNELKPIRDEIESWKPTCRLQSARAVSRRSGLRPERCELSRIAAGPLHRLQPARARALARQGFVEEASDLSSHPVAGVCRVPDAAQDSPSVAARAFRSSSKA